MIDATCLTGHFLIAMPALADPNFAQTVTYLSEHNANGALGLVINRPLKLTLAQLMEHLDIDVSLTPPKLANTSVHYGGPVQPDQGFVLHSPVGDWGATLRVNDQIGITTSRDILQALAVGKGPTHWRVTLGYSGWAAGQLEQELVDNAWLSSPADFRILFDTPHDQCWSAAAALLGINLALLSSDAGHA